MRFSRRGRVVILTSLLAGTAALALWLRLPPGPAPPACAPAGITPVGGTPHFVGLTAGRLEPGERRCFAVEAAAGNLLQVEVEQLGVDLDLRLRDPGGEEIFWTDSPFAERQVERALVEATTLGEHVVELGAFQDSQPGDYEMRVEARPSTAEDRPRVAAFAIYSEAEMARREKRLGAARAGYRQAASLFEDLGDRFGETLALARWARLAAQSGKPEEARDVCRKGERLARDAGWRAVTAELQLEEGWALLDLGDLEEASMAFDAAAEGFAALGDLGRQSIAINEWARVYERAGRLDVARRTYEHAAEVAAAAGEPDFQAACLNNAAQVYSKLGRHQLALDRFTELTAWRRRLGKPRGTLISLLGRGRAERRLGRLDAAQETLHEVLRRSLYDARDLAPVAVVELGLLELRHARLQAAERYLEAALDHYELEGPSRFVAHLSSSLAVVELERDAPEPARRRAEKAFAIYDELADQQGRARAFYLLARAERLAGRLERAWQYSALTLELLEVLRQEAEVDDLQQSYLAWRRDYVEHAVDLAVELYRSARAKGAPGARQWLEKALATSERGRARNLLDMVRAAAVELAEHGDPELVAREVAASRRLIELGLERLRLEAERATPATLAATTRELRRSALVLSEIRSELRHSAIHEAGEGDGEVLRPAPFDPSLFARRHLGSTTALLEISLGEESGHLFLLSGEDLEVFPLPGRRRLDRLARLAHQYLEESHKPAAKEQAERLLRDLSEVLLAPLADRLAGQRLVVVAEGGLQYLPFAALPDPRFLDEAPPPRLLERHEVVSLPSAAVLGALRARPPRFAPGPRIAVVADPVFDSEDPRLPSGFEPNGASTDLERLPHTATEAETILSLLSEGQGFLARGFDANVDLFQAAGFRDAAILHVATHGRLDAEQPELSGLELSRWDAAGRSRRGTLYAHELYGLSLRADLAVLSACRTALGREIRGEGLVGLTRGFFHAGVPRVVVSLWSVDDRATQELMVRFYRHLLDDGLPPAQALRAAQLELASGERWSAPYHWAGFVLQGDWR